ncbi:MAG: hypothetical protein AAF411_12280 [Myxococcota bacterium]
MRLLLTIVLVAVTAPAFAQEEACAPQDEGESMANHRLLRQLSLDLFGRIPTMEEWNRLEMGASIDEDILPGMFESEEYFARVREQHRALVWGSLGNIQNIDSGNARLARLGSTDTWRVGNMRRGYRGASTVECLDQPQPAGAYDAQGYPQPIEVITGAEAERIGCDPADGRNGSEPPQCRREGYVMVAPYWDPANPIKVCAFDARDLETDASGQSCAPRNGSRTCGCGPNLDQCLPSGNSVANLAIRRALEEEPARIFEAVIRDGRSYMEAFTTQESYVNGASAHYYDHLSGIANPESGGQVTYDPLMGSLQDTAFLDETWRPVQRPADHAGVLTTLGYLLRFASNRSRANRFYTAFRCEPFVPPAEGLPEDTSEVPDPNLRERTGCASCHGQLEVVSAAWGRWRGNGTHGFLNDELLDAMAPRDRCTECGLDGQRNCSAYCNAYFVTGDNSALGMVEAWDGYPLSRAYLSDAEAAAINAGPSSLVDEPDEVRRVASCAVRTAAERLFGRTLTTDESVSWVAEMTDAFEADGFDYSAMVERIVSSEIYRTVR